MITRALVVYFYKGLRRHGNAASCFMSDRHTHETGPSAWKGKELWCGGRFLGYRDALHSISQLVRTREIVIVENIRLVRLLD